MRIFLKNIIVIKDNIIKYSRKVLLQIILIVGFFLLSISAVGIGEYLSNKNGQALQLFEYLAEIVLIVVSIEIGIFIGKYVTEGKTIHFEVEDTGIGIPETELEKIFEPFSQIRTGKQSQEGTGLGLAIARKFVQLMGGELTVSSQLGRGSIFKFDIQVLSGIDLKTKTQTTRRVIALEPNQPRYRILIADDQQYNRQLLIQLLSPLGFSLAEAKDGIETLNLWHSWQPHLIFIDVRMPGISGIEVTKQIKAKEAEYCWPKRQGPKHKTAIVVVTASTLAEEKTAILEAGCDHFISQPFRESEIFESLTKYLGVRYVYEILEESVSEPEMIALEPANLAALPPDLVERLEKATICANLNNIYNVIDEISKIKSTTAEALKYLVGNFDDKQILIIIEGSKELNK